jgi:hypothetical protein
VFSTMNVAFQPKFPSSFSNPSAGMQLEVSVNSIEDDDAQTIATCSLWVQRGPRCIATVVSGNCIVLPFSNGDTCFSNTRTQKAFFCQSQYNPATVPDLQLQLFFKDVVPANDIGNFKIVVNGSGSSSSNGIGSYWGFAPPEECATSFLLMFCESFVILMHLNLSSAGLSVLPRCSEIFQSRAFRFSQASWQSSAQLTQKLIKGNALHFQSPPKLQIPRPFRQVPIFPSNCLAVESFVDLLIFA